MQNVKNETRRLVTLAVFRELYNSSTDIYEIVQNFVEYIIKDQSKYRFTLTEIAVELNSTFNFNIPEAVVKTTLDRITYLELSDGYYNCTQSNFELSPISELQSKIESGNDEILGELFKFICKENQTDLSSKVKTKITHSFCSFLIDDSSQSDYSAQISTFIIKNSNNDLFNKKLNRIREGVLLYSGLSFNTDISQVGSWKKEMTIYLDTELLFHFTGLNGDLYKSIFLDFYNYVKEINSTNNKQLIKMRYFREVKEEIIGFFKKAESIIRGNNRGYPTTAMSSLLNGCKTASEIVEKKSDFFELLSRAGIRLDRVENYFNKSNYKHNLIDQEYISKASDELGFDVTDHATFLNYIRINRKNAFLNNFYDIGCILLTGNSKTIKVTWHIKPDNEVPLATTLSWITNNFWYKLNKGFGTGNYPNSFSIISKAQIVLSKILNDSVSDHYQKLEKEFKSGNLTDEQVKKRLLALREQVRKPEEIVVENVDTVLSTITDDDIEKYIREREHEKKLAEKHRSQNEVLISEISTVKDALLSINQKYKKTIELLIIEKGQKLENYKTQKSIINSQVKRLYRNFKIRIVGLLIFILFLSIYIIISNDWNIIEPFVWLAGFVFFVISYIVLVIKEKSLNPVEFIKNYKRKIEEKVHGKYTSVIQNIELIKEQIEGLETELK